MTQKFNPLRNIIVETPTEDTITCYDLLAKSNIDLNPIEEELLNYIASFYENHEGVPSRDYIYDDHERLAKTVVLEYLDLLNTTTEVPLADYKALIKTKSEDKKNTLFFEALSDTMTIFKTGKQINKSNLKGREDAVDYITEKLCDFNPIVDTQQIGTLRADAKTAFEEYLERKNNKSSGYGITSGYPDIDDVIRGGKPGDLHFVLGFTSSGKSMFTLNYAYNAACVLGRNVVIFSLEMETKTLIRSLYAIHSAHEKFRHIHPPIDRDAFFSGELDTDSEYFLRDYVIPDLHNNPEYGEVRVEYPGDTLTTSSIRSKLLQIQKTMEVDMLIVDYPELMSPDKGQKYSDYGPSINMIIKSLKQLALTYLNGRGLFILCPYQSNRDGYERATKNNGIFDLRAMSWASEAERACDVVYSVYKEPNVPNPHMIMANLKNRHGGLFQPFKFSVLWTSYFINVNAPQEEIQLDNFEWDE